MIESKYLGNLKVNIANNKSVLELLYNNIQNKIKTRLFYVNAHCFNIAQKDDEYLNYLNEAELVLNDGIGIEIASKFLGVEFLENLNGTDFTPKLLKLCEQNNFKVYLLGGNPGVSADAAANMKKSMPNLSIVGESNGYFINTEKMITSINKVKPDVLIVALGVPLQEKWIAEHYKEIEASLITGVGAFLDFAAGNVPRAPKIMRKFKVEWLYRLYKEPKRLWRRYLLGNIVFFYNVYKLGKVRKK